MDVDDLAATEGGSDNKTAEAATAHSTQVTSSVPVVPFDGASAEP